MSGRLKKNLIITVTTLALAATGCGCSYTGTDSSGRPVAAVVYPQQAALLRPIVGDEFEIVTLLPPGSDPETYEPSMSTMKALTHADILFAMGTPGFEEAVLRGVGANFPDLKVIDSSAGIERLTHTHGSAEYGKLDHGHGHSHGHDDHEAEIEGDPHLLTSVRNARIMAANMVSALSSLNPAESATYRRRLASLDSVFTVTDDSLRSILARGARPFVMLHPSLSYFAHDYGLTQLSMEQDGKEPSPRMYAQTMKTLSVSDPALLVTERTHSSPQLKAMADEAGIPELVVDLNSEDWIANLYKIAEALTSRNAKEGSPQKETIK